MIFVITDFAKTSLNLLLVKTDYVIALICCTLLRHASFIRTSFPCTFTIVRFAAADCTILCIQAHNNAVQIRIVDAPQSESFTLGLSSYDSDMLGVDSCRCGFLLGYRSVVTTLILLVSILWHNAKRRSLYSPRCNLCLFGLEGKCLRAVMAQHINASPHHNRLSSLVSHLCLNGSLGTSRQLHAICILACPNLIVASVHIAALCEKIAVKRQRQINLRLIIQTHWTR